jgi:hypothetical protein
VLTNAFINGPGKLTNSAGSTITMHGGGINADFENRGTIRATNHSTIGSSSFSNAEDAFLRVLGNGTIGHVKLTVTNGFTNHGTIELGNTVHVWRGDLEVSSGTLVNDGTIVSRSTTLTHDHVNQLTAEVNNRGAIQVDRVMTINKSNVIHRNTGTIEVLGGNLTVAQSGELAAFIQNGVLTVAAGRVATISGSTVFLQGGSIGGVAPEVLETPAILQLSNTTVNLGVDLSPEHIDLGFATAVVHGPGKLYSGVGYAITLNGTTVNADVHTVAVGS